DVLGCAVPRDQALLLLGRLDRLRRPAVMERFYHDIGWEGDRARCLLLLAEVARRQHDREQSGRHLEAAAAWALHSGSVEHLGLLHLTRSRVARTLAADVAAAQRALDEGLHLARQCGLGLYQIELLCEQAEVCLARAELDRAEGAAHEGLRLADAATCQCLWGAARAGHLLGRALGGRGHKREARAALRQALDRRRRLDDPEAGRTEGLLASLGG